MNCNCLTIEANHIRITFNQFITSTSGTQKLAEVMTVSGKNCYSNKKTDNCAAFLNLQCFFTSVMWRFHTKIINAVL